PLLSGCIRHQARLHPTLTCGPAAASSIPSESNNTSRLRLTKSQFAPLTVATGLAVAMLDLTAARESPCLLGRRSPVSPLARTNAARCCAEVSWRKTSQLLQISAKSGPCPRCPRLIVVALALGVLRRGSAARSCASRVNMAAAMGGGRHPDLRRKVHIWQRAGGGEQLSLFGMLLLFTPSLMRDLS
ncbi:hypothetical protein Vafri_9545, partial [Volvox africanus]